MKRVRRTLVQALFLLLFLCFGAGSAVSYASSKTNISSVTIHVKSRLESGDSLARYDVVIGEPGSGEIGVWTDNARYNVESAKITSGTKNDLKVGQSIKIRVVIEITDNDYRFKSGLKKSNVHVSGSNAEVSGLSRSSDELTVTITMKGIRGTYSEPEDAEWSDSQLGRAEWSKPDSGGSGYYEVLLRRGNSIIKRVTDLSERSYDFYPYMTKAGTYRFQVRTVPHTDSEKKYGRNSDWEDSDDLTIEESEVSDGAGAVWDYTGSAAASAEADAVNAGSGPEAGRAGWYRQSGSWFYMYPDGALMKSGWARIGDLWYAFDDAGRVRTGWILSNGKWYFLSDSGAMLTGRQNIGGSWYFLNEDTSSAFYGSMAADQLVNADGKTYYVDADGHLAHGWTKVGDHMSYFDPATGEMARDTIIDTFYIDRDGVWKK